jgi:cytosine/uracil/thiamine/allantoin permease
MGNQTSGYFITHYSAVEGHEYDYNPAYNQERAHADYTYFYAGILVCAIVALLLVVVNVVLGCCSPWKKYWGNRYSGNRLALPLFITTPKDQEPILL